MRRSTSNYSQSQGQQYDSGQQRPGGGVADVPLMQRGGSLRKQVELQRRLVELGQGQLHGARGLPGVDGAPKGAQTKLAPSQSLGLLKAGSRSTKLLIPANQPFRVKMPSRPMPQGLLPGSRAGVGEAQGVGAGAQMFKDDDEVQHLPTDGRLDTLPDQARHTERDDARRRSSKLLLQPLQHSVQGAQLSAQTPKILTLGQLQKGSGVLQSQSTLEAAKMPLSGMDGGRGMAQGRGGTPGKLTLGAAGLPISKSVRQLPSLQPQHQAATSDFLNAAISSKDILQTHIDREQTNPQFQRLNLAPYLKESRDFVNSRRSAQRASTNSLMLQDVAEKGKLGRRLGSVFEKAARESHDPRNENATPKNVADARVPPSQMTRTTVGPALSQSKAIVSQVTGVKTTTPLGPSLGSVRSISRTRIEQAAHLKQAQRNLSRQSKMNVQVQQEISNGQPIKTAETEDLDLLDSRMPPLPPGQQNSSMKGALQALAGASKDPSQMSKQEYDERLRRMKLKLKAQSQQQKDYHDFMHSIKPSNSRQNIVPGQTDAQQEALRSQLLIGKLKANEHLPTVERLRGKAGQAYSTIYSQDGLRADLSEASSRAIPAICSDQVSGMSFTSSEMQNREELAAGLGAEYKRDDRSEPSHAITKLPSKRVLGKQLKKDADYKPHDHVNIEESPMAKQHGLGKVLERRDEQLLHLLPGVRFQESTKETEAGERGTRAAEASARKRAQDIRVNLEQLIQGIQNSTGHEEGYFIYLKQNDRSVNPYDLVPVMRSEGVNAGQAADRREQSQQQSEETDRSGSKNRAKENLSAVDKAKKQRLAVKKVFKSQYHQDKKEFKFRQSYEGAPITAKQSQEAANQARGGPDKYYTLSKKGMTTFKNGEPDEFTKIEDWLAERAQFNQISQKKFFKKFRIWKIIRMWRRHIVAARREDAQASLRQKLFAADPVFGHILLDHRYACKDLEKYRVVDVSLSKGEPYDLASFRARQAEVRTTVSAAIRKTSDLTRERFLSGITFTLDKLREKISKQEEADQKDDLARKMDNLQPNSQTKNQGDFQLAKMLEKMDSGKGGNAGPVYEQLGFKHNMKFGARSELRDACKKFLRFAFLLDFVALESLSNVYLLSMQDCQAKLKIQVGQRVAYDLESAKAEQQEARIAPANAGPGKQDKAAPEGDAGAEDFGGLQPSEIPLFVAACEYWEFHLDDSDFVEEFVDPFVLPPLGRSTKKDFNPMVHLELEPEKVASEDDESDKGYPIEEPDSDAEKLPLRRAHGLSRKWLDITPNKKELSVLLNDAFQLGFDCLKSFEQWANNAELKPYDSVLEPWDYRSYEKWDPPTEESERYLNCGEWLQGESEYIHLEEDIDRRLGQAMQKVDEQFERFEPLFQQYWANEQLGDYRIVAHERLKNPTEVLPVLLERLKDQADEFADYIPVDKDLGLLRVNFANVRNALTPEPKACIKKLEGILPKMVKKRIEMCRAWMQEQIHALRKQPEDVDSFVTQIQCLEYIEDNYQEQRDRVELNDQIFRICERFDLPSREDKQSRFIDEVYQLMSTLNNAIYETKDTADKRKDVIKRQILKEIPALNARVEAITKEIMQEDFLKIDARPLEEVLIALEDLETRFADIAAKKKKVQMYQKTMDMGNIEPFNNVEDAKVLLQQRARLWKSISSWTKNVETWQISPFEEVDVGYILEQATLQAKIVLQCERNLPQGSSAVQHLKKLVFEFKETMPIVEALGNVHLQEEHWAEIKSKLQIGDFPLEAKQFSLGELVDLNVAEHSDEVVNISVTATQEHLLRGQLEALAATWRATDFELAQYKDKDAPILVNIDKVQVVLDESMQSCSAINGSRYVKRLQPAAQDEQDRLNLIFDTLEQWRDCQRNWMYLESIFSSGEDIRKQRPRDAADFDVIDKSWVKLMKDTFKQRSVRRQCGVQRTRLNELMKWNAIMEKIQKNLEEYLEEKREQFPRFYFISNEELLRILASSTDLRGIEKHATKCFENMKSFVLQDEVEGEKQEDVDNSDLNDIYGVKSLETEKLMFGKRVLKTRGSGVEQWMRSFEEYVVTALQKEIKEAHKKCTDETVEFDRKVWVRSHISQAVAVVGQVTWTEGTELALNDLMDDNPFAMEDYFELIKQQLQQLTELIRGQLTSVQRKTLVALITQDVHARDIVEQLHQEAVHSPFDFLWQRQLRYYLDDETAQVYIRQANAHIQYGYEYLGPTSRLVITPLTDKCWLTITGAMHIKLGASPAGPAGTGKTESTKDLAKACGIFCVVINCSDQIEYRMMAKLFSGLVQSGSWTCLDEFNRINIEVLSVIAQQLLDIKQAKTLGKEYFMFNEKERELKQQCGVFITMNPGYAGRTELPDNLKVLFRPVSMMIPAYGLIAEIMLFAEGFGEARALSKKMVQLYKLASEQLSQQDHYDFGLRAVKSVLVMAGNLKRDHPELPESIVLIRAMRDSNIPKFLAADLPLFSALIQDLFPGVEIPTTEHKELEHQVNSTLRSMNFQIVDKLNEKVIQLFETLSVRFGVMIVGPTGGGKTTTIKVLAESMSKLREQNSKDHRFQHVKVKVLNPKSISMGELYGEEDADTQEWSDGLASKILRKFAQPQKDPERKNWCVFDGPVDALWIENMNTVLDDNMTLCLVNGERIKLNYNMRILFEVQDLSQASPATVSRCGMLYLTPSDLGWRPYFRSWKENYIQEYVTKEQLAGLDDLFERYVDMAYERMEKFKGEEVMPTIPLQNVQCLCNFLEHFIRTPKLQQEERKDQWQKQITSVFAFSMIWAFGAAFDQPVHRYLDTIFRDFFGKLQIPTKDSVFQYFYHEKEHKFQHWKELVGEFETRIEAPYDQLFVPTIDSVSYTKVLQFLTDLDKKVFFTGATGVGKSIIAQEFIKQNQDAQNYAPIMLNFSAQTGATTVQRSIESKLVKKRGKKVIGASGSQQCLIFIDDINMPLVEEYGAQPPIEFLRLLVDAGIIYDKPAFFKKSIDKYKMICAAAPPGGGRAALTPRFMRHFHIINIPTASEEILTYIFDTIINQFLSANLFPDDVKKTGNIAVAATIDMFTQFNKNMLPIPSRFHYLFNLRDVSRVIQGVLMTEPQSVLNAKVFARLWLHECQRIFHDRLVDDGDRRYFKDLAMELLQTKFKEKEKWNEEDLFETNFEENRLKVTFSMIMKCDNDEKLYEEVRDLKKLIKLLEDKTIDYNFTFTQAPMGLIFFEDAIDHICRITRVLNQPRGNAMLIGVSGGGKQSLTKLAAFLLEASCSSIKLQKNYRPANFRDDMKVRLLESGCERRPNVFLLADTQIVHEQFLEDVNCILNTGEIADLYEKEDTDRMAESLERFMREQRIPPSQDNIYQTYIKQLRLNFHIILCMSPVGDLLRVRCRNFPSLVNCCTLDWFDNWPEQALKTVSEQFFTQHQMLSDNEALRNGVISMFPKVHRSVENLAAQFFEEQKRRVYVTPKTYLDALGLFKDLLIAKQAETQHSYDRLNNGITKLEVTNEQIKELKVTLTELAPKLQEEKESAGAQVEIIQEQSAVAREREIETENEARKVQHEAKQIGKVKEEAEAKLNSAKPALVAAEKAVNELSRDDINELKQVKSPPPAVEPALQATLIYLGHHKYDWPTAQKAMADMRFLDRLKNYDREAVPDNIFNKVTNLTNKASFDIDKIQNASKAAGGLAKWCKAVRDYAEALKIVRPLQERLAVMTSKYQAAEEACRFKQQEVDAIKAKLQQLQDDYQGTLDLIEKLNNDKEKCERRLSNASKLLSLLGSEGERWKEEIALIRERMKKFVGDVFVSASQMSYLGPFTGQYREPMVAKWVGESKESQIELSEDYSLIQTLGDPIEIRKWGIDGLPSDQVSTENAIFTTKSQRWPMLIDPQFQANAWLKKMYRGQSDSESSFVVTKISSAKEEQPTSGKAPNQFAAILEGAVRHGSTMLLEDMDQEIDPSIEAIVSKQVYKADGILKINLGNTAVDYHEDFKLLLTTKLPNPHFLPEVSIKVAVINFTVTFDGLDDQLLAEAVKNLEPELEKQRDKLVIEISSIKNEQFLMQSSILTSLAESNQDTILDNEKLIETLAISKEKSKEIAVSLKKSEMIGKTVQEKREQYREVSVRGSVLYFVIASLSSVDPMYQNSLAYVKKKFNETIRRIIGVEVQNESEEMEAEEKQDGGADHEIQDGEQEVMQEQSEPVEVVEDVDVSRPAAESSPEHVGSDENAGASLPELEEEEVAEAQLDPEQIRQLNAELISNITQNLYVNVCRGLFEAHKIIFSFMICTSIKKNLREIDEVSYNILLRGQGVYDKSEQPDYREFPAVHDFLTEQQWDLAYCIQLKIQGGLSNLLEDLLVNQDEWRTIASKEIGENDNTFEILPSRFRDDLPLFLLLLLIKLIRPQLLVSALKDYVVLTLGREYATSPLTSMDDLFGSSDKVTPVIFVLSQGADPNEQILQHAKKAGFTQKLFQKSLGQGQERAATHLLREGSKNGDWILLQNCHLFKSWMPQLEAICADLRENYKGIHRDFRLILTSMPVHYFPASVLQNGVKMTTEPPQGLKANMKRIMTTLVDKEVYGLAEADLREIKSSQNTGDMTAAQQSRVSFSQESAERNSNSRMPPKVLQQRNSMMLDFERQFDLVKCWKALLFGLSFFHSIIQERKKFGSLGWNIRYEFNDSDLETSIKMLQNFLFDSEEIPWDSMQFMTGHINYGGRVTDDIDRILLICLLKKCYGEHILDQGLVYNLPTAKKKGGKRKKVQQVEFSFFNNPNYKIPQDNESLEGVQRYIEQLPNIDEPEICGMHKNASISYQLLAGDAILRTIINIQQQPVVSKKNKNAGSGPPTTDPRKEQEVPDTSRSPGSKEKDEDPAAEEQEDQEDSKLSAQDKQVIEIAEALFENRPMPISSEERSKEIFKINSSGLLHCFSIVLLQEQERYNKLIGVIHHSLEQLLKAIQGLVLMSADLDQMYNSFLKNQVPANWQAVSYASQKPLASWFKDLHKRVEFMRKWMMKGHPSAFWLSGFFFPHGFMTGILQTYARKHRKAIDFLKFRFNFLDAKELADFVTPDGTDYQNIEELDRLLAPPQDGAYIYGLYIESARWCATTRTLQEQAPGVVMQTMPIVHFQPFEVRHIVPKQLVPQKKPEEEKGADKNGKSAAGQKAEKAEKQSPGRRRGREAPAEPDVYAGEEDTDLTDPARYLCPVYKTSSRAGALSTTGQSTNYILSVCAPINPSDGSDHWTLRGAAMLTMHDV